MRDKVQQYLFFFNIIIKNKLFYISCMLYLIGILNKVPNITWSLKREIYFTLFYNIVKWFTSYNILNFKKRNYFRVALLTRGNCSYTVTYFSRFFLGGGTWSSASMKRIQWSYYYVGTQARKGSRPPNRISSDTLIRKRKEKKAGINWVKNKHLLMKDIDTTPKELCFACKLRLERTSYSPWFCIRQYLQEMVLLFITIWHCI